MEKKNMHWSKWENLCKPKVMGGLSFRNLTSFNKALLAKQVWSLLSKPTTLMARVLKAKYYRTGSILAAQIGSNASFIWRSLCWSCSIIMEGTRWRVASGISIRACHDAYVDELPSGIPRARENVHDKMTVAEFITSNREWNYERLQRVFQPYAADAISRTVIAKVGEDRCFWQFNELGVYSVKTGYLAAIGYFSSPQHTSTKPKKRLEIFSLEAKHTSKGEDFHVASCYGFSPYDG